MSLEYPDMVDAVAEGMRRAMEHDQNDDDDPVIGTIPVSRSCTRTCITADQRDRHAALAAIGHHVVVIRATTEAEAAERAVAQVRSWLAENDNAALDGFEAA